MSAVRRVCVRQPAAVLVEELAQRLLGVGVLGEHALAGDLGDVRGSRWTCTRKAVHEPGQLDPRSSSPPTSSVSFSCEVTTSQCLPRPTRPRLCTTAWRSSIFCTSRATNWPTSSTTKTRLLPGPAPLHQLRAALGQLPGVMSARSLTAFTQQSAVGIGLGLELVHHPAGLAATAKATLPFSASHSLPKSSLVARLEGLQPALGSRGRSPARRGRGPGVAQALQEEPVHDLGEGLVAAPDAAVGGDVEDDGIGRDLLARSRSGAPRSSCRPRARRTASRATRPGSWRFSTIETQDLREARLAGAEEARDPDADPLVRLVRRLPVALEDRS